MKHRTVGVSLLLVCLGWAQGVRAEEFTVKAEDTLRKVLDDRRGREVTLRLTEGGELTGKVHIVGKELVHLSELSGQECFDGVVEIEKISAIVFRVREQ